MTYVRARWVIRADSGFYWYMSVYLEAFIGIYVCFGSTA
jgi:hypothetical protein